MKYFRIFFSTFLIAKSTTYQQIIFFHEYFLIENKTYSIRSGNSDKAHDLDSNQLALEYLEKAIDKSMGTFPELEKERGLIYTRLNHTQKAKESFLKYQEMLLEKKANGINVENELLYINQMLQRRGFLDKNIADSDSAN